MFYKKKNLNKNNTIKDIQDFKPKSDFVENNIFIPFISKKIKTISFLFNEIEKIHNEIKNEQTEYAQRYKRDFDLMVEEYYIKEFGINNPSMIEEAKSEAKKLRELLLNEVSSHLYQYINKLKELGDISNQEKDMQKIQEYMIKAQSFMSNIKKLKNKIFSIVLPLTTITIIDSRTKEEKQTLYSSHPIKKIGILPFETIIDEIASLCENGIKSIDSWFKHLKDKRVQQLEAVVNQSKVQVAQEQAKAAKLTFRTQLGFMILSVIFIIVSFCLAEYKEEWIYFFKSVLGK